MVLAGSSAVGGGGEAAQCQAERNGATPLNRGRWKGWSFGHKGSADSRTSLSPILRADKQSFLAIGSARPSVASVPGSANGRGQSNSGRCLPPVMGPGGEAASTNNVGSSFLSICAALLPCRRLARSPPGPSGRSGKENLHNANAPYHFGPMGPFVSVRTGVAYLTGHLRQS